VFDQWGELPFLPFGNPIGFVPASRGGVYIELSNNRRDAEFAENICFAQSGDSDWAKTSSLKGILEGPLGLLWTTYLTESLSNLLSSGAFYNLSPLRRKMTFEGLL